ncbi:hypothetical protein EG329_013544 [Mollisiaceae sp. DMI_Dod_QoI]|nr:hypothetical protein EG329_013544 [Helotiales sp. DMI_Dod_QoI]
MPPKCCSVIPISSIAKLGLLTTDQIELYKAKYEEWSTPDRLYCTVPTCSAFISPRLYVKPTLSDKITKSHVSCPNCGTTVCTKCRSMAHIDECSASDLDPTLEEQLKKWKIKRCPKCRTGVRKMFGCAHVECRCSAHFCWECLNPIGQCDGTCEDESENEPAESEFDEDDLDGRAGYYDGDEHDFGPEPYGNAVDAWGCHHIWLSARPGPDRDQQLECQRCFRAIRPLTAPGASDKIDHDGDVLMSGTSQWQCVGAHMACFICQRTQLESSNDRPGVSFSCWCGATYCPICDRNAKIKELETGYECRCGMLVCGACKSNMSGDT